MRENPTTSICIFGSFARNKSDIFSDKDVLIVADKRQTETAEIEFWSKRGWSVAFYTWSRLEKMALSGSLFVQHLKQDGLIQRDPSNRLKILLQTYSPKHCYQIDLTASTDLARPLDRVPCNRWEAQMQCDVSYTFVRNAGILYLASMSIYEFEYLKIIEHLADIYSLSELERKSLTQLRPAKAQYRARQKTNLQYDDVLAVSRSAISKMFDIKFKRLDSSFDARLLSVPYGTLREIEARLISYNSPIYLDRLITKNLIGKYWQFVTNPRKYSWSFKEINLNDLSVLNRNISRMSKLSHLPHPSNTSSKPTALVSVSGTSSATPS